MSGGYYLGANLAVDDATRSDEEGQGNNGVETEKHSAFEIVGLAVLDGVGDDKNGHGKGNGLD